MSSEDFKSLIVTDPDIVDEGIDVSGLRTTTDTSPFLLGNIPDYSGIQYSTLAPTKYTDLMRLYSQGLPMFDTAQIPGAVDTLVDVGSGDGGGGATLPGFDDPTPEPINTPEQQRLIDEGIGVQLEPGSPVSSPYEGMPPTQEEIDAFNQIPVSTDYDVPDSSYDVAGLQVAENVPQAPEGGSPGILNPATYANTGDPDLLNLAGGEAGAADGFGIIDEVEPYRDPIMDMVEQPQTDSILAGEAMRRANTGLEDDFLNLMDQEDAEIEDIPVELPATNIETAVDPQAVNTILGPDGITYDAVTGQPIDFSAPGTLSDPLEKMDVVTEQDLIDDTSLLQRLGLPADFDLKQAAIEAGINYAVGVPITLIARVLGAVLPDGLTATTNLARETGLLTGDTTVTQDKYGINTQSALGDYTQYNVDQVEKLENVLDDLKTDKYTENGVFDEQAYLDNTKRLRQELEDRKEFVTRSGVGGDIQETGDASIAEQIAEADRLGISGDIGVEGEDTDRFGGGADKDPAPTTPQSDFTVPDSTYDEAGVFSPFAQEAPKQDVSQMKPYKDRFNQQNTIYQKRPEEVETDIFARVEQDPTGPNIPDVAFTDIYPPNLESEINIVGEPVYDERLGWIDSITEKPVENPNLDVVGIGSVEENVMNNFQQQLDSLKGQKEQVGELGLPTDQIDDAIKELEEKIEKLNKELSPIKPVSLNTIDTSDDKPQGPGPSGFVGLDEDMDVDPFEFDDMNYEPPAPPSPPTGTSRPGGDDRDDSPAPSAPKESSYDAEAEDDEYEDQSYSGGTTQRPGSGGGGGGGGGCFLAGTLVTMADGSTKEVQKVDLGDNVAEGGKVFATGKFLVENLHDYKGIKVSGSHMVNEDDNWVRVEDSKHGKPLGDDEYTVYVFGSENRRILINGILFTDYFETTEQEKLINDKKDFFNNWKTYENKIDQDNINILNAS